LQLDENAFEHILQLSKDGIPMMLQQEPADIENGNITEIKKNNGTTNLMMNPEYVNRFYDGKADRAQSALIKMIDEQKKKNAKKEAEDVHNYNRAAFQAWMDQNTN
jgi:hypothetical protein